jgi:hypothetical protein
MKLHKQDVWKLLWLELMTIGIPENCEWITVDKMGDVYGFSRMPFPHMTMWMVDAIVEKPYEVFEFAKSEQGHTLHIDMEDVATEWRHLRFRVNDWYESA